ncbi:hypothetical protein ACIRS1_27510 [Kitasatospora sp. NPDC101176]|uniref:hypothetical protein n=1 Tax=Kitasatospora sp. NPDC101176 TaxID=3364099 RepID=UPI0038282E2D
MKIPPYGFTFPTFTQFCEGGNTEFQKLFASYLDVVSRDKAWVFREGMNDPRKSRKALEPIKGDYKGFARMVPVELERIRIQSDPASRLEERLKDGSAAFSEVHTLTVKSIGRATETHAAAVKTINAISSFGAAMDGVKAWDQPPTNLNPAKGRIRVGLFRKDHDEHVASLTEAISKAQSAAGLLRYQSERCKEVADTVKDPSRVSKRKTGAEVEKIKAAFGPLQKSDSELAQCMTELVQEMDSCGKAFYEWCKNHDNRVFVSEYADNHEIEASVREVRDRALDVALGSGGVAVSAATAGLGALPWAGAAVGVKLAVKAYDNLQFGLVRQREHVSTRTPERLIENAQKTRARDKDRRRRDRKGRAVVSVVTTGLEVFSFVGDSLIPGVGTGADAMSQTIGMVSDATTGIHDYELHALDASVGFSRAASLAIGGGAVPAGDEGDVADIDDETMARTALEAVWVQWESNAGEAVLAELQGISGDVGAQIWGVHADEDTAPEYVGADEGAYVYTFRIELLSHLTREPLHCAIDLRCFADGAAEPVLDTLVLLEDAWYASPWYDPGLQGSWNGYLQNGVAAMDGWARQFLYVLDHHEHGDKLSSKITSAGKLISRDRLSGLGIHETLLDEFDRQRSGMEHH